MENGNEGADFLESYPSMSVGELRHSLARGATSVVDVLRSFRARYEAVDAVGPAVNSMAQVMTEAALTTQTASARGPVSEQAGLAGIPVVVKDCFDTLDGMLTTCGSLALLESKPLAEATAVSRLRNSGALLVGKANLSEWGNFRSTRSASGWSAFGGLIRNPHALDRSPGGSSGGSAAAVAAGLVPIALGTETHGSVICPAAMCGVVGVKTTVGLIPGDGVQPVGESQDTVGVFARSVEDAAIALAVVARADRAATGRYIESAGRGVAGLRVGVARTTSWGRHAGLDALAERALSHLSAAGAVVIDPTNIPTASDIAAAWEGPEGRVLLAEFVPAIERFLRVREGGPMSLAELVAFNASEPRELRWFGQEMFEAALSIDPVGSPPYRAAVEESGRISRTEGIDAALAAADADVLVAPTMPPAWKTDLVNGDPQGFDSAAAAPAIAGYPAISVPLGLVEGLPVGLMVTGPAWSEGTLLRVAGTVESAIGRCPAPQFRPPSPG